MKELVVKGLEIKHKKIDLEDYISITDIAKLKSEDPNFTIASWMRNRMTLEYLGLWESLCNEHFNPHEFEGFRKEAGLNSFYMSPQKWANATNAIGIV